MVHRDCHWRQYTYNNLGEQRANFKCNCRKQAITVRRDKPA